MQQCGAGVVPVRLDGDILAFAAPPRLRSGAVDADLLTAVAEILGIENGEILDAEWLDNGPGWWECYSQTRRLF
ncbi:MULTISPECIES: hypothetical protein [Microbacterium]|uniref:hypothetical protein n=1 Tax=Microbacterium TaxID=33882 RepID=UPI0027E23946|nr:MULTISPECIES: hypothetical protein [Microbacterium]